MAVLNGTSALQLRERLEGDPLPSGRLLAGILCLAFAARVWVAFFAGFDWFTPDSRGYFEQADAILAGAPEAHFPNGFPLLVALFKGLLPEAWVPGALMAANVVLSTAVVGLVYELARELSRSRVAGLLAALAVALYPNQLVYLHYLLTEVPTAFLVASGSLVLLRGGHASGGALLALAALFRSTLLPAVPIVIAVVAVWRGARPAALRVALGAAVVAGLHVGLVTAEVIRPSSNLGTNLILAVSDTSSGFAWSAGQFGAEDRARPLTTYLRFAAENPGEWLLQRASAFYELWGPYPLDTPRAVWENLLLGLRFPLALLALLGLVRHRARVEAWLLATPPIAVTMVHTAFFSSARFTYVVMPLVVALAAGALPARRQRREP